MARRLGIVLLGGSAFAAWKMGYLDPVIEAVQPAPVGQGAAAYPSPGASAKPVPVTPLPAKIGLNKYEIALVENDLYVSPWAAKNREWVAAIMRTENAGMNPKAVGSAGEIGVMQVKLGTATDLNRWGYNRLPATVENLSTLAGGIYFGTAYLDYIARTYPGKDRAWITKAYNGGPGWEGQSASYQRTREEYFAKVQTNFAKNRQVRPDTGIPA